jgi:hypothetical protein
MEITRQDNKAVLRLIEKGIAAGAGKLAKISRTQWEIREILLQAYAKPEDYAELRPPNQYFFGAYCQAEGNMLLSYFSSRSAALITQAFLAGNRGGRQATPQMQELAMAEVSNIVVNAVAGPLADHCGMAFILSAPTSVRGSRADIIKAAFGDFSGTGKIFSARIDMSSKEIAADCTLMLMLDDLMVNRILNAAGGGSEGKQAGRSCDSRLHSIVD